MFAISQANIYLIGNHTRILTPNPVHLLTGLETVGCDQIERLLFLSASDSYILGGVFYLLGELSEILSHSQLLDSLLRPQ